MLAAHGVAIHVHSNAPSQKFNNKITCLGAVAHGAILTHARCFAIDQPPVVRLSTLDKFPPVAGVRKGRVAEHRPRRQEVTVQNDPAC